MITEKYIEDFIEFKKNNKEVLDLIDSIESFDDAETILDFKKSIDLSKYNIQEDQKQDTIESELIAWKKYYKNNYRKASFRDFEPILTKGEIADFIENQLKTFIDNKTIPDVGNLLIGFSRESIPRDEIEKIVLRQLNNRIRRITGYAGDNFKLIREVSKVTKLFSNNITNESVRNQFLSQVGKTLFEQDKSLIAKDLYNNIKKIVPNTLTNLVKKRSKSEMVDFFFELMTGEDLRDLQNTSSVTARIKTRWTDFVRKNIFKTDKKIEASDLFNVAIDVFKDMRRDVLSSKNVFKLRFNDILFKAVSRQLSPFNFNSSIRKLVRNSGREMFRNGIELFGLDANEYTFFENLVVNKLSSLSNKWIDGLTNEVLTTGISTAQALLKVDSWANKTLTQFFQLGRLAADRNGLYEWVYGDTKHCRSCLTANGQRHRLKDWHKAGILPQSTGHKTLSCGGYNCQCKLVRVTGKSFGRLDRVYGLS